jgi:hypothetical protein
MQSLLGPKNRLALVGAVAAAAVMVLSITAFTESNTVPGATVGEGAGTISGYTITSVQYNLNTTTPSNVDSVTFTTSALANTVKIKLVSSGSTWYTCATTNSPTNTTWSCGTTSPQATATAANELRVVAAQ